MCFLIAELLLFEIFQCVQATNIEMTTTANNSFENVGMTSSARFEDPRYPDEDCHVMSPLAHGAQNASKEASKRFLFIFLAVLAE